MSGDYTALGAGSLFFRAPAIEDLDTIHAIEVASYPEDEAATCEKLEYRIRHANEVFLVAVSSGSTGQQHNSADEIVGYVCGTCSSADALTHESMSVHEPEGRLLCIHSVCVAAPHRRKGVATKLLRAYLPYVGASSPHLEEVRLICKEDMVPLYAGVGFKMVGPSPVVHGQDPWLEMVYSLQQ